jgi:hypothetical protein
MKGFLICLSEFMACIIEYIRTELVDLNIFNPPKDYEDFIWYAERVNGRVAMLTLTTVLILELINRTSIWSLIHAI